MLSSLLSRCRLPASTAALYRLSGAIILPIVQRTNIMIHENDYSAIACSKIMTAYMPVSVNHLLLNPNSVQLSFANTYKIRSSLKKRCPYCYFEMRQGRLFVECKAKPRHKQMQKLGKNKIWAE